MKYLSQYMEARQTEAFDKAKAFFAFGQNQFDEKKQEWVRYCDLWGGLICPKENYRVLVEELDTIYKDSIKQDIEENWLNAIIRRELNNHECFYTWDPTDAIEKLSDYPVSKEDIIKVFKNQNYIPILIS